MTHTIKGLSYEITIELDGTGGGTIESNLKDPCPHCGSTECNYDCDGSKGADPEHPSDDNRSLYNAAIDGLESLILAQACAGVPLDKKFDEAVETAISSIANHYGD